MAVKELISRAEIVKKMTEKFGYKNVMQVPALTKISVNRGLSSDDSGSKTAEATVAEMTLITGQKPTLIKAKKSEAGFKLRAGMTNGCKVTLRNESMEEFFFRLVNVVIPRMRDFRGLPKNSFDGRGNYTLGLKEQIIFPEIHYDKVDRMRGFDISFVTSANTDDEARELLKIMGMPLKD